MTTDVSKSNLFFDGNSPVEYIYEDEQCVVFEAKDKQAPVNLLIVPRKAIPRLYAATADDEKLLGHILLVAKKMVLQMGLDKTGYHLMVDENHITNRLKSVHVFGRALHHMIWPVGPGCRL